jgi:hypothetical protein
VICTPDRYTRIWLGDNLYGEAIARLEMEEHVVFVAKPSVCLCLNVDVGGKLQAGVKV